MNRLLTEKPKIARTSCKNCVFAVVNLEDKPSQEGCTLNNLIKLENNGASIIECFDEEQEFYVIENRFCNSFRPKEWADKQENLAPWQSLATLMRQENAFSPDVIIYCDKNSTIKDITQSFKRNTNSFLCDDISYKPNNKHVILDETNIDGMKLQRELSVFGDKNIFVHRILNNNSNLLAIIDGLYNRFTSNYLTIVTCDANITESYYKRIDNLLNNEMKRLVLDIDNEIITISRLAMQMYIPYSPDALPSLEVLLNKYPNGLIL